MVSMRTSRAVVLTVAVTTLATACHSSTATSGGGTGATPSGGTQSAGTAGSASPTGPAAQGSGTCRTAALRITLDSSLADAAAGSTYYPVDFTNTSAAACVLA